MAGFHVTGVDNRPQPHYCGDAFIRADALNPPVNLREFDFVWASPPCQAHTALRNMWNAREHLDLIPQTRELLKRAGVPYVIENVEGAPLGDAQAHLTMLCGTMFRLGTDEAELRRHRLFESSFWIPLRPQCQHGGPVISVHWEHARDRRRKRAMTVTGHTAQTNVVRNRDRRTFSTEQAQQAMGIGWMGMKGLSQAIPPAYSHFIAQQFLEMEGITSHVSETTGRDRPGTQPAATGHAWRDPEGSHTVEHPGG